MVTEMHKVDVTVVGLLKGQMLGMMLSVIRNNVSYEVEAAVPVPLFLT